MPLKCGLVISFLTGSCILQQVVRTSQDGPGDVARSPAGEKSVFSGSEKTAALENALKSEALARSDRLRSFLRYVCEMEIAGRGAEITEYSVGVDALGRPEGYSIVEDPCVRKRAYELRHRLEKMYESEYLDAPVRIEIPKGTYVPRFVPNTPDSPRPEEQPAGVPPVRSARAALRWRVLLGVALVATLAAGFLLGRATMSNRLPAPDRVLAEAWGPMSVPDSNTLICVATNLHLLIRPHPRPGKDLHEAYPELYPLFRLHRPLPSNTQLWMEPALSSVTFGEVWAAVLASHRLRTFQSNYQLLPERVATYPALRDRNAIVIGVPADSDAVSKLLATTPLTVAYSQAAGDQAVLDRRKPDPTVPAYATVSNPVPLSYGLITVLPAPGQPGVAKRTVVFSGIGSVGAHGAAEFFCSEERMREFRNRLKASGLRGFPTSYQVVVRCRQADNLLISAEYASHVVLQK